MGEDSIKLLTFWSSPFALRARLGLELKGLKYELQEEDLFNTKSELLLQSNPVYKKVRVLIHNGKSICESAIILQYIDETWPDRSPAFLPKDPFERAQVLFWVDFVDKKLMGSNSAGMRAVTSTGEEREKALEELNQIWAMLEECLSKKRKSGEEGYLFGGKEMNMVDLSLSFVPWFLPGYALGGVPFPGEQTCPLLHKWIEAVEDSTQAQHVYPAKEKITEYMKKRLHEMASAAAATPKSG